MKYHNITDEIAQNVGDNLGVDWDEVSLNDFRKGLIVELEHGLKNPETNITNDDIIETGKIALVHLQESPKYYTDLENDAEPGEGEKEYLMAEKPKIFNEMQFKNKDKHKIMLMKDKIECDNDHNGEDNEFVDEHDDITKKLPKLMGGGLIELLHNLVDGSRDMEHLSDDDLDEDDPIAKLFKNLGGMSGTLKIFKIEPDGKKKIKELSNRLQDARNAMRASILRHIFSCVQEAKENKDVANNQRIAVKTIDKLMKDSSAQECIHLNKAKRFILNGDTNGFDIAALRVKNVFSNYVPDRNIRVAYTTLRQQDGEPYQLCPKMRFQIGYAAPMEISKCREQCIDSKISVDGKVICAYADWVKYVADNQNAVNARLEVHKNPDKGIVIGTLAYPQRTINTNGEMNNTYEHMLTEKQKETEYSPTDSLEARLDEVPLYDHKGDKGEVRIQDLTTKTAQKHIDINNWSYHPPKHNKEFEICPECKGKKNIKIDDSTIIECPKCHGAQQDDLLSDALIWGTEMYGPGGMLSMASKMEGINPYCEKGLNYEAQIDLLTPDGKYADETIEAMLQDSTKGLKEKDIDELMSFTNLLQKQREDTPKRFKSAFNINEFRKAQQLSKQKQFHSGEHVYFDGTNFVFLDYLPNKSDEGDVLIIPVNKKGSPEGKPYEMLSEYLSKGWDTEGPYCTSCKEPCEPKYIDTSFDHAFGTENQGYYGSSCCEAPMSQSPDGNNEIEDFEPADDRY